MKSIQKKARQTSPGEQWAPRHRCVHSKHCSSATKKQSLINKSKRFPLQECEQLAHTKSWETVGSEIFFFL